MPAATYPLFWKNDRRRKIFPRRYIMYIGTLYKQVSTMQPERKKEQETMREDCVIGAKEEALRLVRSAEHKR